MEITSGWCCIHGALERMFAMVMISFQVFIICFWCFSFRLVTLNILVHLFYICIIVIFVEMVNQTIFTDYRRQTVESYCYQGAHTCIPYRLKTVFVCHIVDYSWPTGIGWRGLCWMLWGPCSDEPDWRISLPLNHMDRCPMRFLPTLTVVTIQKHHILIHCRFL